MRFPEEGISKGTEGVYPTPLLEPEYYKEQLSSMQDALDPTTIMEPSVWIKNTHPKKLFIQD